MDFAAARLKLARANRGQPSPVSTAAMTLNLSKAVGVDRQPVRVTISIDGVAVNLGAIEPALYEEDAQSASRHQPTYNHSVELMLVGWCSHGHGTLYFDEEDAILRCLCCGCPSTIPPAYPHPGDCTSIASIFTAIALVSDSDPAVARIRLPKA